MEVEYKSSDSDQDATFINEVKGIKERGSHWRFFQRKDDKQAVCLNCSLTLGVSFLGGLCYIGFKLIGSNVFVVGEDFYFETSPTTMSQEIIHRTSGERAENERKASKNQEKWG